MQIRQPQAQTNAPQRMRRLKRLPHILLLQKAVNGGIIPVLGKLLQELPHDLF